MPLCRHPLLHLLLPHLLQPLSALGWQWTTNPFLNPCYNQGRDSGDGWPDRCLATKGCVLTRGYGGDNGTCIPDLDNWGACYGYAAVICYNDPSFECQNDVEVPGCISTCGSKATSLIVCALEDIPHCGGHAYLQPSDDNIGRDLSITLCTMCEHGYTNYSYLLPGSPEPGIARSLCCSSSGATGLTPVGPAPNFTDPVCACRHGFHGDHCDQMSQPTNQPTEPDPDVPAAPKAPRTPTGLGKDGP
jgi:hypothetical protein